MELYHNEDDYNAAHKKKTLAIATTNGYDVEQESGEGKTMCGKHGSSEIIEVYPDGSWEVLGEKISGQNSIFLKIFLKLGKEQYKKSIQ